MLFGRLRELAGVSREYVTLAGAADLSQLVRHLEEKHGRAFGEGVAAIKGLRILVNGREYELLAGMETRLSDKDTVVLLPPIEGG